MRLPLMPTLFVATTLMVCGAQAKEFEDWQASAVSFGEKSSAAIAETWDIESWSEFSAVTFTWTLRTEDWDRFATARTLGPLVGTKSCRAESVSVLNDLTSDALVSCWVEMQGGNVALLIYMTTIGYGNWRVTDVLPLIEEE